MTLRLPTFVATHRLIHLSDTHLTPRGVAYNGVIDTDATLAAATTVIRRGPGALVPVDAVVVSGDLTDTGDPDAYARLRAALEPLGLPVIYATGNHDRRTVFNRDLLGRAADGPQLQVHDVRGLRIVVLDSTIVGAGQGRLAPDHLAELVGVLATPAAAGSILVLHHPPIPAPTPLHEHFALDQDSRDALARAISGTDVRMILAGHHHLSGSGTFAGVPVAVAGSVAIHSDPLVAPGQERTTQSGALNVVTVYQDTITVAVAPIDSAPVAFDLDQDGRDAIIAANPLPD